MDEKEFVDKLDTSDWSLSHERDFMENLFVGRFNYFIVVFSLFLTAGFANSFKDYKSLVFFSGSLVLVMIWSVLYRAFQKYDRVQRLIYRHFPEHPMSVVDALMNAEGFKPRFAASRMMGIFIPAVCSAILLASGLLTAIGVLSAEP